MKNQTQLSIGFKLVIFSLLLFGNSCQSQTKETQDDQNDLPNQTEETATETDEQKAPAVEAMEASLEPFSFTDCTPLMEEDSGCSCGFRPEKDNYKSDLFISNIGEMACIKVNGNIQNLTGDRIDNRSEFHQQSFQENWILLQEGGVFQIFGKDASHNEYEENRETLIQTLLVMDEMPEEIPMQFVGTTGMGMRAELRDMANEALEMAKKAKAEGSTGIPMQMLYQNDQYEVHITGFVDGKNDSGGDTYAGTIELKNKAGKVLDSKKF